MLTPQALRRPYRFLADFAAAHQLPVEVGTEHYELDASLHPDHPDAWKLIRQRDAIDLDQRLELSKEDVDRLRRLVIEMGVRLDGRTPDAWTPQERAVWCLSPTGISAADLNEIRAVATAVAGQHAAPERALARHRSGLPLEDSKYGNPSIAARDPAPVSARDQQAVRLQLLSKTVFAPPYTTTEWMVRWVFRRPRRPDFTRTIVWLRQGIDMLAALADRAVRASARQYRHRFFAKVSSTCLVPDSKFAFWAYGYGEVGDPLMEARAAEQARAFPFKAIDHVAIALSGDAEAVYAALQEAGTAALRWPWVLRVLDGWRAAVESSVERDKAQDRLRRISPALASVVGPGRNPKPNRIADRIEAVELLRSYFEAYARAPSTPIPPRLLEIGNAAHEDSEARAKGAERGYPYTRLDAAAIVAARARGIRPDYALRVAREVVAAAFTVARTTVVRET